MSQKNKYSNLNLLHPNPDRCSTKASRRGRFTKPATAENSSHKSKERHLHESTDQTNQHLLKNSSLAKQRNIPSDSTSPLTNVVQYSASDDSALVEVTVKTSNPPKQRSKSTVSDREPWGQMLKKNKVGSKESVFSNFDPLRTLHFLAKELQIHVHALLPDELNVQEIIKAMQLALKRVPPEVASTIHLQQSIGLLPGIRQSASQKSFNHEIPEKPYLLTEHKSVQTVATHSSEDVSKIQKLMEDSTLKLETSCRHLETLCTQLRNEKIFLEGQLQSERANTEFLKKRIDDLENLNKDLSHTLYKKDEQITQLKSQVDTLEAKIEETHSTRSEIKSIIGDLKKSKVTLEQDCVKLKHQLRLCAIEKEKYLAILGVRDRQIHEIRSEMAQLQEVVNDQLVELHNNAIASMPSSASVAARVVQQNKENVQNGTLSSIHSNEDEIYEINNKFSEKSLNELQSEESEVLVQPNTQNVYYQDNIKHFVSQDNRKEQNNSCALFCDLSKALDCVSQTVLLQKLEFYGFCEDSVQVISSYLQDHP